MAISCTFDPWRNHAKLGGIDSANLHRLWLTPGNEQKLRLPEVVRKNIEWHFCNSKRT